MKGWFVSIFVFLSFTQLAHSQNKEVGLFMTKVFHSGLRVGKADLIFNITPKGVIDSLKINGKVGFLGIGKQKISRTVTMKSLLENREEGLEFSMEGATDPVLRITVDREFSPVHGGKAKFEIFDGTEFKEEEIFVDKKDFKITAFHLPKGNKRKRIIGLSIFMAGLSLPKMHVKRYKVKTK